MELITASQVITGVPGEIIEDGGIIIDKDTIVAVGIGAELRRSSAFDGASSTHLDGKTLLPGLIDCHIHLALDASDDPNGHIQEWSSERLLVQMLYNARSLVAAGVTTARDLGAPGHLAGLVRDAINNDLAIGPRLLVSNQPITVTGGHGWYMGSECDDITELRRAVREHRRAGADVIKIMSTGGFLTTGTSAAASQFTFDEVRTVVDEAHHLGMRVASHAHGTSAIRDAVVAGVDSVEHCTWVGSDGLDFDIDLVEEIVRRGVFVCATTNARLFMPSSDGNNLGKAVVHPPYLMEGRFDRLRIMREAGMLLVVGTDAGIPMVPHRAYAEGVMHLSASGMRPLEMIEAATSRAASACGVSDVTGSLVPGKQADVICVEGDLLSDFETLRNPVIVIKGGRRCSVNAPD